MLSVAVLWEAIVLAHDLHHHRNGLISQLRILRVQSALRWGWPIDEIFPDEFMKGVRNIHAGTARTARMVAENIKRVLVALASERDQCIDIGDFHSRAVKFPTKFL